MQPHVFMAEKVASLAEFLPAPPLFTADPPAATYMLAWVYAGDAFAIVNAAPNLMSRSPVASWLWTEAKASPGWRQIC
jgi:hypothetical protein